MSQIACSGRNTKVGLKKPKNNRVAQLGTIIKELETGDSKAEEHVPVQTKGMRCVFQSKEYFWQFI